MTVESLVRVRHRMDLLAPDLHPECPYCHELNAAGASVCGDCGGALLPVTVTPKPAPRVAGCECPEYGMWTCPACVLYRLDNGLPL